MMFSLMVAIMVLAAGTSIQGYDEGALFERYSKMKLLTTCLGEETMARWRQQMMSAGKECHDTAPLIPALLHQIQTVSQRQPFVSNTPLNVQQLQQPFRPSVPGIQQSFQQNTYYQQQLQQQQLQQYQLQQQQLQQQQLQKQQNPFYQQHFSPFLQEQYYIISSTSNSNPRQQPRPVVYQQPSYFKPVGQKGWPIYQQGYTYSKTLPGNLAPTIQYITAPSPGELGQLNSQAPNVDAQRAPASSQNSATPPVVRQKDTYINPHITVEQTEAFQQQQQLQQQQQKPGVQRVPGSGPPKVSSFHQQYPFPPPQQGVNQRQGINKREAKAEWPVYETVSPSRQPSSHQQYQPSAEETKEFRLRAIQSRVSEKISNMTCVLRAMKMLTPELEPDLPFMESSLLELPISHELFEELKSGMQFCREVSHCQPRRSQLHHIPITKEFSSSLEFFRCFGKEKLRACLKADLAVMSQMLGSERGPFSWPGSGSGTKSTFNDALQDLDDLLNGGSGDFVDLVLL